MTHEIKPDIKNSTIHYCVMEYVRDEKHQEILLDRWFRGATLESLSLKYGLSVNAIKNVVYGIGDGILARAGEIEESSDKSVPAAWYGIRSYGTA